MQSLVAVAVFIGSAALFVIALGLLGDVGSIELLIALIGASAVTAVWVYRRSTRASRRAPS